MQKWEYKIFGLRRVTKDEALMGLHHGFRQWNEWDAAAEIWVAAEGGSIPFLNELGQQGWELVDIVPLSDRLGQEFAGSTTTLYFYLKRPKTS